MKLSTKSRYGTRAMLDLALHYSDSPIILKDIAERQQITEGYLENIMTILVSGGLVVSRRGKQGGFSLAKPPYKICLGDVVQLLEGPLSPVSCVDNPGICERQSMCVTCDIWNRLKVSMQEVLGSITLRDMMEMHEQKQTRHIESMYFI